MHSYEHRGDVAVVGGGVAGLAAAALIGRSGRKVRLFEQSHLLGGRAQTKEKDGFYLNIGPHALYRGGRGMEVSMTSKRSLVSVVDDDESIRESLPDLLREFGLEARAFSSAEEFLASDCIEQSSCLILDIAMPGMTGPELQQELRIRQHEIPIIFITGQRDEAVRKRALERGAVECLFKPFSDTALCDAVNAALG